ncbi:MAG: hypothetical protein A2Y17_01190 [Clostridiales bacterium GWF2_38_85]|nr:MAG: hypothetical protein A2Y17_01190 [Clostridiales bacterium GWF2_38_85]HBL85199.1 methyltransferase [Clostridiales bacterium]
MNGFICPVCGDNLISDDKCLLCNNRHSFDRAKSGYVNLLLSQQSKQHGDDKLMVRSRRDFLDKGYYRPLLNAILELLPKYVKSGDCILDAGCGECYYTAGIYKRLKDDGITAKIRGVDISKDALASGAKRCTELVLAVASVYSLPVGNDSTDILLSFFAPYSGNEFLRVLKPGGIFMRVFPLQRHLFSLKSVVYEKPYENKVESYELEGFELIESKESRNKIHLESNEDIRNVFSMTPYYYKTSSDDIKKLDTINELETEIEFGILMYRK